MSRDNTPSELLPTEFTEALESFKQTLAPLGNHGLQAEKNLKVITPVLPNRGNGLKPASLNTQTFAPESTPVNESKGSLAPAAKLTEQFEYMNAESIEDNHG